MISDAAIEAAADVIRRVHYPDYVPDLVFARKVLEAAAPHLLADAWDEGNIAGVFDLPSEKHATTNPYRSQT